MQMVFRTLMITTSTARSSGQGARRPRTSNGRTDSRRAAGVTTTAAGGRRAETVPHGCPPLTIGLAATSRAAAALTRWVARGEKN